MKGRYVVISETYTNDNEFFDTYEEAYSEYQSRSKNPYFGKSKHCIAEVMEIENKNIIPPA